MSLCCLADVNRHKLLLVIFSKHNVKLNCWLFQHSLYMMLTHYNILLSSINTLLSQIFASGWLLHPLGFFVAFVSANII